MCIEERTYTKWKYLKARAKERGLEFNLSLLSVRNILLAKHCYYTGVKVTKRAGSNKRTVDRVDSKRGYVKGNVVCCADFVNQVKADKCMPKAAVKALARETRHGKNLKKAEQEPTRQSKTPKLLTTHPNRL